GLAFAAERALDGGERAHFRLPAGAIGVPALHLEQLLILHPATERLQERRPLARDDAGGREPERSREPRERAVPLLDDRAGLLLEQRLLEVARRDADVLPQREELVLRQPLADVALRGLELGRALDDPLERLAADELARHRYASTLLVFGAAGSVSPEALCGSAGAVAWRATESRNPLNRSMGIGKNVVELFSEEISVTVCR